MYVSIRDENLIHAGYSNLAEGLQSVKLNAVEIGVDREMLARPVADDWDRRINLGDGPTLAKYRGELAARGLRVSSILLGNDFGRPDLDKEIAWVARIGALANELGADSVRIDAIMHEAERTWPEEKRIAVFIESMKKVLTMTEQCGTQFGIENHGVQGNDPAFLHRVIDGVGSSRLGNTLDTANFYWSGKPLDEVHRIIAEFAPSTRHTHMKSIAFPADKRNIQREMGWGYDQYVCAIDEGDIDIPRTVALLKAAGYKADLCIENEALGRYPEQQRQQILQREAQYLKSLV